MYDADAIEAINFEQLVTVTDRLLLRRGNLPKGRPSAPRIGPSLEALEHTAIIHRPQRAAIDVTVVLSSAILTVLMFIAILA